MIGQIYLYFFSWMPISLQVVLFAFISLLGVIFVLRLIALIKDILPLL